MKGKLLLIVGIIAIAGIAYANSDFIDVSKIMSMGSSSDIPVTCTALSATDPPTQTSAQTGTVHGQSCTLKSNPGTLGIGHLGLLKNKHCSDPPFATITITVPFKTNSQVTDAPLGTITLPITTNLSVVPSIAGSATISFTTGSGNFGVSSAESDTISGSGTLFTITDSGITVTTTTSGSSAGMITIKEVLGATIIPPNLMVNTPLATPSISGTDPSLNTIICPTVTATFH